MKTRAITGFFFVIVMLASVLCGPIPFIIFYLILSLLCLYEFLSLIKQGSASPVIISGLFVGLVVYLVFYVISQNDGDPPANYFYMLLVPALGLLFIQELFRKTTTPFANIAYTIFGAVFTVIPFSCFVALGFINKFSGFNFHFPLAFLLMLWANDTGAYLTGMAFGRTKLFERHSPKKTWEGFIGGVLISAGVGLIISHFYADIIGYQWAIMGVIIGTVGTIGDLVESMFKRSINVKDSGGILPGHGGLLDRFDGLFLAVPVVYTYLYLISN
jgi:phosphatidate cytidylyltransferase